MWQEVDDITGNKRCLTLLGCSKVTGNELGGMTATKLRITNKSGEEQKVYFKSFTFIRR